MNRLTEEFDWKWLITTVLAVGILGAMAWMIRQEVVRLAHALASADSRMTRMENALRVLADAQDEGTRKRVNDALAVAQNAADSAAELIEWARRAQDAGDFEQAAQAANRARAMLLAAAELGTPAPPAYFIKAQELLEGAAATAKGDAAARLFAVRIALAEYRSAIEPTPAVPEKVDAVEFRPDAPIDPARISGGATYALTAQVVLPPTRNLQATGAVIDGSRLLPGKEVLKATLSFAHGKNTIDGVTFKNVTQTLDGAEWKDVLFVNARIRYRGGQLRLNHVRFADCTFEISESGGGAEFAKFVALAQEMATIGEVKN